MERFGEGDNPEDVLILLALMVLFEFSPIVAIWYAHNRTILKSPKLSGRGTLNGGYLKSMHWSEGL